jgi:hypothetical protein
MKSRATWILYFRAVPYDRRMTMSEIKEFRKYLGELEPGPVSDVARLEDFLVELWPSLPGSGEGGMMPYKISGRTESMRWEPPCIFFSIERHGGTVNGSTRAEIQDWCVNTAEWNAGICSTRRRQLKAMAPRMNVKKPAEKIAQAILNHQESPSLKWHKDGRVRVLIATVVPDDGYQQTISSRRKRFRKALEELIAPSGWACVGTNTYGKT